MILAVFESASNVKKSIKRLAMSHFSGEIIHCELVSTEKNVTMSAWYPAGVQIRERMAYNSNFETFLIGNYDEQVFEFFRSREGLGYNLNGLFFNMILNLKSTSQRHFCSQICYDALLNANILLPENRTESLSPQEFYFIIKSNFSQLYL